MSELNRLDLAHEEKRVRSILKTPEGLQALRNVTGLNLQMVGQEEVKKSKPRVAVLMPSHSSPKPETTSAFYKLVEASRGEVEIIPQPSVASSVVHWVRNDLLTRLYKSGVEFDYVLFMDDDIVPPPDALIKLLAHGRDIVAGACTVRQDPPLPNFRSYNPETYAFHTAFEWNGEGLVQVGAVGTGFMLISRKALDLVGRYYIRCCHEREFFGMSDEKAAEVEAQREKKSAADGNRWWFEFLKHPLGEGEYGEDISFCFKARQMGFEIFVDTTVKCGHVGNYPYSLDDYFQYKDALLMEKKYRAIHAAVVGRDTGIAPRPLAKGEATGKVSVLLPTRGRPELLKNSVASLLDNATGAVEVIIAIDNDDPERIGVFEWFQTQNHDKVKIVVLGTRHGYQNLNRYYDELATLATGDWLLIWNDDALMLTPGWDAKIHEFGNGLKVLNAGADGDKRLNLFPILTKQLYDLLGSFGPGSHLDSSIQAIARLNGIEYPVDIEISHQREQIDDQTKQESLGSYAQTRPEFFSEARQTLLLADIEKVKTALQ